LGIIEKQATRNAIYSYLGAGLGFFTITWLSHLLSPAENGAIGTIMSYAVLFSQFANLGFTSVTSRFFPYFRNKDKGHNGFLFYALLVSLIGFILCWVVFLFLKPGLIESNQAKSPLFITYLFYLMPLTLFSVFFNILDSYLRAGYNSVIGSFTKEFLLRIFILILLAVYWLKLINFEWFIGSYIALTCLPTIILIFYIIKQKEWHIRPVRGAVSPELRKEMVQLGMYSIITGGAGAVVLYIDNIMVNQMLGEAQSGIYRVAFYFGTIILIPARSIYRVTSGIVSEHFKTNKIKEIGKLYNQACNNQLMIGLLLFIGVFINIDNVMLILDPAYASCRNVILIISGGYVVEMATGINQVIIANSKYYKYDTYFVFVMMGITIFSNYLFIPIFGIIGSAIATALTVTLVNILRYALLYYKYQMQPYDHNTLKLLLIALVSFLPGYFIPHLSNMYLDITLRSGVTTGIFLFFMLKTEATPDINQKIRKNLLHLRIK
jgi:O-antigen/teichoic acid export membrane protein